MGYSQQDRRPVYKRFSYLRGTRTKMLNIGPQRQGNSGLGDNSISNKEEDLNAILRIYIKRKKAGCGRGFAILALEAKRQGGP